MHARILRAFARHVLKWNRLEKLDPVPLGAPMADVIALYGKPIESRPTDDFPGGTTHTFAPGRFHEAVIGEFEGRAGLITYWSAHADPIRDLRFMLTHYGDGIGWNEVERGYWYWRKDGKVRLWCSAVPAIGVATTAYFEAKNAAKNEGRPPRRRDRGPWSV